MDHVQSCSFCLGPLLNNIVTYSCGHIIHQHCHQDSYKNWASTRQQPSRPFCCAICRTTLTTTSNITEISTDNLYNRIKLSSRILNDSISTSMGTNDEPEEFIAPTLLNNISLYTNCSPTALRPGPRQEHPSNTPQFGSLLFVSTNPIPQQPASTFLPLHHQHRPAEHVSVYSVPISTPLSIPPPGPFRLDELSQPNHLANAILLTALSTAERQEELLKPRRDPINQQHASQSAVYPTSSMLFNIQLLLSAQKTQQQAQKHQIELIMKQQRIFSAYLHFTQQQLSSQRFMLFQVLQFQLLPVHLRSNGHSNEILTTFLDQFTISQSTSPHTSDSVASTHTLPDATVSSEFDFQTTPASLTAPFPHQIFARRESIIAETYSRFGIAALDQLISLSAQPLQSRFQINKSKKPLPPLFLTQISREPFYRTTHNVSLRSSRLVQIPPPKYLILPQLLPSTIHASFSLLQAKSPISSAMRVLTQHFSHHDKRLDALSNKQNPSSLFNTAKNDQANSTHPCQQHIDEMFSTTAHVLSLFVATILSQTMNSILILLFQDAFQAFHKHWNSIFQSIRSHTRQAVKLSRKPSIFDRDHLVGLSQTLSQVNTGHDPAPIPLPPDSLNNLPLLFSIHVGNLRTTAATILENHTQALPSAITSIKQLVPIFDTILPTVVSQSVYLIHYLRLSFQQSIAEPPPPIPTTSTQHADTGMPTDPATFIDTILAPLEEVNLDVRTASLLANKLAVRLKDRRTRR